MSIKNEWIVWCSTPQGVRYYVVNPFEPGSLNPREAYRGNPVDAMTVAHYLMESMLDIGDIQSASLVDCGALEEELARAGAYN